MTDDQVAAILARIDRAEADAAERHAELLARVARAEDAANCADLTADAVRSRLDLLLREED